MLESEESFIQTIRECLIDNEIISLKMSILMLALIRIISILERGPLMFSVFGTSDKLSSSPILSTEHHKQTILIHLFA